MGGWLDANPAKFDFNQVTAVVVVVAMIIVVIVVVVNINSNFDRLTILSRREI